MIVTVSLPLPRSLVYFAREPEATESDSVETLLCSVQPDCVEEPSRLCSMDELIPETEAGVCPAVLGLGVGLGVGATVTTGSCTVVEVVPPPPNRPESMPPPPPKSSTSSAMMMPIGLLPPLLRLPL